ncbi:MAG TPA: hypothetical protein VF171_07985, partial [Trueperaceae bacterium]
MPTPLTPQALLELTFVSDPQLSADGRYAAAVHTVIVQPDSKDEPEDEPPRYQSHIVLHDLHANQSRNFTDPESSATSPRFSPDGSLLAFLRAPNENE